MPFVVWKRKADIRVAIPEHRSAEEALEQPQRGLGFHDVVVRFQTIKRVIVNVFQAKPAPNGFLTAGFDHSLLLEDVDEFSLDTFDLPAVQDAAKIQVAVLLKSAVQAVGVIRY